MGDQANITSGLFLFIAAFLGTGVEMVEAMTIILATGITRGWRSTFIGAGSAALVLAAIVAALVKIEPSLSSVLGLFLGVAVVLVLSVSVWLGWRERRPRVVQERDASETAGGDPTTSSK